MVISDNWHNLSNALSLSIMLWMMPMIVAMNMFAPEISGVSTGSGLQAQQNLQGYSPDFLLTRAIDRPMVFRTRAVVFWIAVLLPAIGLLGLAAWRHSISFEILLKSPVARTQYLEGLPGASITKTTKTTEIITSPTGRLAIVGVMGLFSVVFAAFWQGFASAVSGLKFKRWLFRAVFIGGMVGYFCLLLLGRGDSLENLIFLILKHPIAAVGLTGIFVAAAWAFSEARAKRIEYP